MNERLYKALNEKNAIQRYTARRFLFNVFQRFGLHITGDHFYEIVPNTRFVAKNYRDEPRALAGINFHFPETEERAVRLVQSYGAEYSKASELYGFREKNYYFRGLDALMLYCVLRELKPRKLVEVGQGFSTCIALSALHRNTEETGESVQFISIDPYARFAPSKIPAAVHFERIQQELQEVDLASNLEGCGFLFIDSSHVFKFGSDVAFEMTQLYPQLKPGTTLHVHDIFSPYDYPLGWIVDEKRFWNEQYLLESFLMFNEVFRVHLPVHWLSRQSPRLRQLTSELQLPANFKYRGCSFYLQR